MIFKDKGILKAMWGGMFFLCALLGYVPQQEGANRWLLLGFALLFFVPPALLLRQCQKTHDQKNAKLVRNLSLLSLSATALLLATNLLSILLPEAAGNFLYYALILVSTPMVCGQFWFVSLFLWASLLWGSLLLLKNLKK